MARERYLVGAGEDTIHSGVIELKTASDKRKNWWYYHKKHLFIGLIAAALAVSAVYSIVSKVEPDYTIGMLISYNMPSSLQSQLEEHIAQYGEDRNGDGQVVVRLNPYVFSQATAANDPQSIQANFTRFAGDAAMDTCMIFFHDDEAFQMMADNFDAYFQYNDGSPMPEGASNYQDAMLPWEGFAGLADFDPNVEDLTSWTPEIVDELLNRLRVSVRACQGAGFASDEEKLGYYQDCLALLEKIKAGAH